MQLKFSVSKAIAQQLARRAERDGITIAQAARLTIVEALEAPAEEDQPEAGQQVDFILAPEVERQYGLASGTVSAYINRYPDRVTAGDFAKWGGVWVMHRDTARRIWG